MIHNRVLDEVLSLSGKRDEWGEDCAYGATSDRGTWQNWVVVILNERKGREDYQVTSLRIAVGTTKLCAFLSTRGSEKNRC